MRHKLTLMIVVFAAGFSPCLPSTWAVGPLTLRRVNNPGLQSVAGVVETFGQNSGARFGDDFDTFGVSDPNLAQELDIEAQTFTGDVFARSAWEGQARVVSDLLTLLDPNAGLQTNAIAIGSHTESFVTAVAGGGQTVAYTTAPNSNNGFSAHATGHLVAEAIADFAVDELPDEGASLPGDDVLQGNMLISINVASIEEGVLRSATAFVSVRNSYLSAVRTKTNGVWRWVVTGTIKKSSPANPNAPDLVINEVIPGESLTYYANFSELVYPGIPVKTKARFILPTAANAGTSTTANSYQGALITPMVFVEGHIVDQ